MNTLPTATAAVVTSDLAMMAPLAVTVPPRRVVTVGFVVAWTVGLVNAPRIAPPTARPVASVARRTVPRR